MKTKYYRFLYHSVSHGICFSASIGAEKGRDGVQMMFLSEPGEQELPESARAEHLDLLILADREPQTIGQAEALLEKCRVDTVLLPHTEDKPEVSFSQSTHICEIAQTHEISMPDLQIKLYCSDGRLIVFAGGRGEGPAKEICMMNVKPCTPDLPCEVTVDAANLSCEMRCMLCADHTQCKRHNRGDETYFVDGHLLVGTADLSKCHKNVREYFSEEWRRIRFVGLPEGGMDEDALQALLDVGTDGNRRYYIGSAQTAPETIKAIETRDAFHTYIFTGERAGLCVSGCYQER